MCLANIVKAELKNISGQGDIRFVVSSNPEEFKLGGKFFFNIDKPVELYDE